MNQAALRASKRGVSGILLSLPALGAIQLVCLVRFCRLPLDAKLARIPDDGFYYLNLADNFARRGEWTFDLGISHTTGFHPLYAWIAAALSQITADPDLLVSLHGALGFALTWFAAGCTLLVLGHDARAACGVMLVFGGGACLSCPLMLMEWPFVVATQALLVLLVLRGRARASLVVGVLAVLARVDAIVPIGLCALGVVIAGRGERFRAALFAMAGALGTFLGYGLHLLHTTGSFFQGSARMKAYWTSTQGIDPLRLLGLLWRTIPFGWWAIETPSPWLAWTGALVLGSAVAIALARLRRALPARRWMPVGERHLVPMLPALAVVLGTYTVYALRMSGAQAWYTAHFIVPMALLCGMGFSALFRATPLRVPGTAVLVMAVLSFIGARVPIWPHHRLLGTAGQWVRDTGNRAVAFNAGIVGYFSASRVVNLDGLVNDDIQPYIFSGQTACYIEAVGADVLVDVDCTGRPERELQTFDHGPLARATKLVHTFGRVPEEPRCLVAAWQLDRRALRQMCGG
ncbi:hypothetical protein [Pendulispora albinea]|uniref:Mannosyltransferase n=1 Tax=Pendulispora albinea TaxID=2741071 RepID=A0ABZ2M457_9BACT